MTPGPAPERGNREQARNVATVSMQQTWRNLDSFRAVSALCGLFLLALSALSVWLRTTYDLLLILGYFLTAYAAGSLFRLKGAHRPLLEMALRFAAGALSLGLLIWVLTLFRLPHREIFLLLALSLLYLRRGQLRTLGRNARRLLRLHLAASPWVLFAFALVLLLLMLFASRPVTQFDAVSAHVPIVAKVVAEGHQTINVIESIIFSNTDLLMHMSGVMLMQLGGTKSLVYFNSCMASLALLLLLAMLRKKTAYPRAAAFTLILLFGFTPIVLQYSVVFYQDMLPCAYLFLVICLLLQLRPQTLIENLPLLGFLLGGAVFAKRTGIYMALVLLAALAVVALRQRQPRALKRLCAALALFAVAPLGPVLLVWHKTGSPLFPFANGLFQSEYYTAVNFKDPFRHPLGLDLASLWSMVFRPDRNMEIAPYGLGIHLLAWPLGLLAALVRRERWLVFLCLVCLGAYFLSTRATYNIRYFLSAIVLALPVCVRLIDLAARLAGRIRLHMALYACALLVLLQPCIGFMLDPKASATVHISRELLKPDASFVKTRFDRLFGHIANKQAPLFLNYNQPQRGAYAGFFSSNSWYNDYQMSLVRSGAMPLDQFLSNFSYVISADTAHPMQFDLAPLVRDGRLKPVFDDDGFTLYSVCPRQEDYSLLLEKTFEPPATVTVTQNVTLAAEGFGKDSILELDIESEEDGRTSRFQVNWHDRPDGAMTELTLVPFELRQGRRIYSRPLDTLGKRLGLVYVTSHDERPITVHSCRVWTRKPTPLDLSLERYSRKWPN